MKILTFPFLSGDLWRFEPQPSQKYLYALPETFKIFAENAHQLGPCKTLVEGERIVGCVGLMEHWDGRAEFWGVFTSLDWRTGLALTKRLRLLIEEFPVRRLETLILGHPDSDEFPKGHAWARVMGFSFEGYMRSYTPAGKGMSLYSKIRD